MPKEKVTPKLRQWVTDRAQGCCEYCYSQADFATQPFSVEHIVPRHKQGTNSLDNLALSCQGCNNHKYTKTEAIDPISQETVSLYHPRKQSWSDHFYWNDDCTLIIGRTPIGRATIEALQLNRASVINLRQVLHLVGKHPPFIKSTL